MAGTELHIIIRQLINNQGASFIADKRFANILLDMGCFDSCPKCKHVIKTINENDYANRILSYIDGFEPKDDTFTSIFEELSVKYNYATNEISYCVQCLLYGLNILDGIEKYSSKLDYNWLNQLEEYCSTMQNEVDAWNTEYCIVNVMPANAEVYIDGRRIKHEEESFVVELAYGEHRIKSCAPMYYNHEESFEVTESGENRLAIELKPQFGSILIMTNANDATIYIDDVKMGKAPFSMEKLPSGTHTLKITDALHKKYEEVVTLNDGQILQKVIEMETNFGNVALCTEDEKLQIYIDGQYQGDGSWKGQLPVGHHTVECKKESHFSKSFDIYVKLGNESSNTFDLPELEAYYGCLKVNVLPIGSTVYLDGQEIGKSPLKYKNALTGKHIVTIVEQECGNKLEEEIEFEEGVITVVEEPIPQIFFKDYDKAEIGDYFYIDGTLSHQKSDEKIAVGMVFTLETTEEEKKHGWTHGQIIALKNCTSKRIDWNKSYCYVNPELKTYSDKEYKDPLNDFLKDKNGYKYSHISSINNNREYNAFYAALNYNNKVQIPCTSGWYLPTIGQFNDVLNNLLKARFYFWEHTGHLEVYINNEIESKLKLLNLKDDTFWTCSLMRAHNTNYAWIFRNFNYKHQIESWGCDVIKGENSIRAVAAF